MDQRNCHLLCFSLKIHIFNLLYCQHLCPCNYIQMPLSYRIPFWDMLPYQGRTFLLPDILLNATQIMIKCHGIFLLKAPECLLWLKNNQLLTQFTSTNIYQTFIHSYVSSPHGLLSLRAVKKQMTSTY